MRKTARITTKRTGYRLMSFALQAKGFGRTDHCFWKSRLPKVSQDTHWIKLDSHS